MFLLLQILLNNTRLHLKRGKRYGICGYNGCGKSTLMRAIANGQVRGRAFFALMQLPFFIIACISI